MAIFARSPGVDKNFRPAAYFWHLAKSFFGPVQPVQRDGPLPAPKDEETAVTYIGHATTLMQMGSVNILTDPVYSQRLMLPRRLVAPGVAMAALPKLDLILVSHGHFDHLDLPTHDRLPKEGVVVTAKNLSDLLLRCGHKTVVELEWGKSYQHRGVTVTALPVNHWGTRGIFNDGRGYTGFLLESAAGTVFFPGDTAYDPRFTEYGERFHIDIALLPIGAYNPPSFRRVHMNPEDAVRAFTDLQARYLIPIHWGTFILSYEPPDEPITWIARLARQNGLEQHLVILRHGESRLFRHR